MGRAKDIIVKPIAAGDARRIIKTLHYSGKVDPRSQVHLGAFLDGKCGGALQFGPSIDKRRMMGLVDGTMWNEFIELNRMALSDWMPRNGESRVLSISMRLLKMAYPWMKWVVSFADATQCGDGAIYRASGFVLTSIKRNRQILRLPNGEIQTRYVLTNQNMAIRDRTAKRLGIIVGKGATIREFIDAGANYLPGHQLRYVYFLDPNARDRLTVPIIPFSEIERRGARMYLGKSRNTSIVLQK